MSADCYVNCCDYNTTNHSWPLPTPVPTTVEHKCDEARRTKTNYTCADEQIPIPGCIVRLDDDHSHGGGLLRLPYTGTLPCIRL